MPTLLLVRPTQRQAADIALCQHAGWQAVPFAPIELRPNQAACTALPQQIAQAQAMFWVSPSAVEIAQPFLQGDLIWRKQTHIAVGQATAHALQSAGCLHVHTSHNGNDSEAALQLPIWQTLTPRATILIVRGQNGREHLAEQLRLRNFVVQYAPIYQRIVQTLNWTLLDTQKVQAAWVTSSQMAQALFSQAPPSYTQMLQSLLYFTHHTRIADALAQNGATQIRVCSHLSQALQQAAHILAKTESNL